MIMVSIKINQKSCKVIHKTSRTKISHMERNLIGVLQVHHDDISAILIAYMKSVSG